MRSIPGTNRKNPCLVDGVTYQDGETFAPDCSQVCTCQNGFYGCSSRCPHEFTKPSGKHIKPPGLHWFQTFYDHPGLHWFQTFYVHPDLHWFQTFYVHPGLHWFQTFYVHPGLHWFQTFYVHPGLYCFQTFYVHPGLLWF